MIENIFLHIGVSRTGTTSLQKFMKMISSGNYEDFLYPKCFSRSDAQHIILSESLQSKEKLDHLFGAVSQQLSSELEANLKTRNVFLSDEGLCELNEDQIRLLKEYLFYTFNCNRIKIFIVAREQAEHAVSQFCMDVSLGYGREEIFKHFSFYDYANLARKWASQFGSDSVEIIKYSNDVCLDVLKKCGFIAENFVHLAKSKLQRENVSIPLHFACILNNILIRASYSGVKEKVLVNLGAAFRSCWNIGLFDLHISSRDFRFADSAMLFRMEYASKNKDLFNNHGVLFDSNSAISYEVYDHIATTAWLTKSIITFLENSELRK